MDIQTQVVLLGSGSGSGSDSGTTATTQTFTSSSSIRWRVLSKDESTGEVVLISEFPLQTDPGANFYMNGAIGYLFAEDELNNICEIYGNGTGASKARSINADDINKITGYTPKEGSSFTHCSYYPERRCFSTDGISTEVADQTDINTYDSYAGASSIDPTSDIYKVLFPENMPFWLGTKYCGTSGSDDATYGVMTFNLGSFEFKELFYGGASSYSTYAYGASVRPIVYLKTTVTTSGKDAEGEWIIVDN